MTLVLDDKNQIYYWCDNEDETLCLSPHFDYEEDAIQWYGRISKQILSEFGVEKGPL